MTARATSLGRQVARGSLLSYTALAITKAVAFVSTLVLVRLLGPSDFGVVGYALVVIGFLDVVKDLGVTAAVVYRQDEGGPPPDEAFVLAVSTSVLLAAVCWVAAPLGTSLLGDGRLTAVTRVLSISLVIDALGAVHASLLRRQMRFGRYAATDVVLSITKAVVAVGTAGLGLGYWSLVYGQLAGTAAATVAAWRLSPWVPRPRFRWPRARPLLGYGLHVIAVDVLGAAVLNADNLVVGSLLGGSALGLYALAFSFAQLLTIGVALAVSTAAFPALASLRSDLPRLRAQYLSVQRYSALALVPVGTGILVVAPALVHALFRPIWWPMAPVLQALAVFTTVYALRWAAGDAFKAVGRPDLLWRIALGEAPLLVGAVLVGATVGGIRGAAVAHLVVVVPFTLTTFWLVHRVVGVRVRSVASALRTPAVGGVGLVAVAAPVAWLLTGRVAPGIALVLEVMVAGVAYAAAVLAVDRDLRAAVIRVPFRPLADTAPSTAPPNRTHRAVPRPRPAPPEPEPASAEVAPTGP